MIVAFVDLDDTVFQTREKCPEGDELTAAANDKEGNALSFTTRGQRRLLEVLASGAVVIPATGRNIAAYRRVLLEFRHGAVVNHGATILGPDGTPDAEWELAVGTELDRAQATLLDAEAKVKLAAEGLGLRVRLIGDLGRNLYVSVKAEAGAAGAAFRFVPRARAIARSAGLELIANGRDLALIPATISKRRAVAFLRERLTREHGPHLALGAGDATSDAGFLGVCHFAMMPAPSPLFRTLQRALDRPDRHAEGARGGFSGSYHSSDVTFLLQPIHMEPLSTEEKERRIQSRSAHYSEMIGRETRPSDMYLACFERALEQNRKRFAGDMVKLAALIDAERRDCESITLVSLARAGTPVGVIATRLLRRYFGRTVDHYSISIIRDRGADENALLHILHQERPESLVFLDGWTGKGVIARELTRSISMFNRAHGYSLRPDLFVVADLCGAAYARATGEDYVLPSAILNATVSGLVSRSIANTTHLDAHEFHGCLYLAELETFDRSRAFAADIEACAGALIRNGMSCAATPAGGPEHDARRETERRRSEAAIARIMSTHGVTDENHVKPGIGEATRVLLRRVPELLIVRDDGDDDVAHALVLARERGVPVQIDSTLPYKTVALIKTLDS